MVRAHVLLHTEEGYSEKMGVSSIPGVGNKSSQEETNDNFQMEASPGYFETINPGEC